jgi:hypothetical protein
VRTTDRAGAGRAEADHAVRAGSGGRSAFCVLFQKFDGVTDGQNGFRRIVGNFAIEFLLERHDKLDGIETIGAEIVDEAGVIRHLVGVDAKVVYDDFFYPLGYVTHRSNLIFQRDPIE